jgi:pimeloyl-ACP methyl ester carboxylesterase
MRKIPLTSLKDKIPLQINALFIEEIGGIKQAIKIMTKNSANPVLLFLNGGPGMPAIGIGGRFISKLKKKYTVILWDQRGAGKTRKLNPPDAPPTLYQMQSDTHEVIRLLINNFDKEKIYIAGHSWGTVLGFYIVNSHPELVHCYFAISPIVNQLESEKLLLEKLKAHYKLKGNKTALEELSSVQFPNTRYEDLFYCRKWLFAMEGKWYAKTRLFKIFFLKWSEIWFPVWQEVMKINLTESLKELKCPVYFILGQKDIQTSFDLNKKYFDIINAPLKNIYILPGVGHLIPNEDPDKMQDIMIEKINSDI